MQDRKAKKENLVKKVTKVYEVLMELMQNLKIIFVTIKLINDINFKSKIHNKILAIKIYYYKLNNIK